MEKMVEDRAQTSPLSSRCYMSPFSRHWSSGCSGFSIESNPFTNAHIEMAQDGINEMAIHPEVWARAQAALR